MVERHDVSGAPLSRTGSREPDPQAVPALTVFDPSRIEQALRHMTKTMPRALTALPGEGVWVTASEMKHKTSAASLDVLYMNGRYGPHRLCERRWTRWGEERGQRRGEGYEYTITAFGEAVRAALRDSDRNPKGIAR